MWAGSRRGFPERLQGFTLLELVIVMATFVVLLLVAAPSMRAWQQNQRMEAAVHALHQDLITARSQAIMIGDRVTVCPGNPVTGCTDDSNWNRGWLVFRDLNDDGRYSATEPVIRVSGDIEQITITSAARRPDFIFRANGTAPGSNGSVRFCDSRGPEYAQRIVISNLGRIRWEEHASIDPDDCPKA